MDATKSEAGAGVPGHPTYQELLDDNRRLREELRVAQQRIAKLERQVEELLRLVEKLRGEGKRQAAPFRKQDEPTAEPKKLAQPSTSSEYPQLVLPQGATADYLIAGAWAEFKSVQLNPNTKLDGKTKELIGLAVSAQVPCQYCIYFHTAAAKANGATDQEVGEAVAMAVELV